MKPKVMSSNLVEGRKTMTHTDDEIQENDKPKHIPETAGNNKGKGPGSEPRGRNREGGGVRGTAKTNRKNLTVWCAMQWEEKTRLAARNGRAKSIWNSEQEKRAKAMENNYKKIMTTLLTRPTRTAHTYAHRRGRVYWMEFKRGCKYVVTVLRGGKRMMVRDRNWKRNENRRVSERGKKEAVPGDTEERRKKGNRRRKQHKCGQGNPTEMMQHKKQRKEQTANERCAGGGSEQQDMENSSNSMEVGVFHHNEGRLNMMHVDAVNEHFEKGTMSSRR